MDLFQRESDRRRGSYPPQSPRARRPRSHDSLPPGRRLRQARPSGLGSRGVGKIANGVAQVAPGGHRIRKSGGTRKEAFAIEASRGAEVGALRRQALTLRMIEVRIPAFAKINLRLDILGKRADGYHELRTIFQTLSLHDDVRLRTSKQSGISLTIQGNAALASEPFQKNLVYRAVDAVKRKLKISGGVEIRLKKRI